MIFWMSIFPLIYLASVVQMLPIHWGEDTFHLATLCGLAGLFTLQKSRLGFFVLTGVLDALLSGMPVGFGLIWAGLLGLLFAEDEASSEQQSALLLQLFFAVLLRQLIWFSYEVYLNKLTMSLEIRLVQTALSLLLPITLIFLYTGMVIQLKRSFQRGET
jgi:hypothetical protein